MGRKEKLGGEGRSDLLVSVRVRGFANFANDKFGTFRSTTIDVFVRATHAMRFPKARGSGLRGSPTWGGDGDRAVW